MTENSFYSADLQQPVMTENESDSGPRISSIIQIVLVSNDGEWEWFWAQNQSHYPSGRNPEIRTRESRDAAWNRLYLVQIQS